MLNDWYIIGFCEFHVFSSERWRFMRNAGTGHDGYRESVYQHIQPLEHLQTGCLKAYGEGLIKVKNDRFGALHGLERTTAAAARNAQPWPKYALLRW
jgi:hypothetical protein